MNKNKGYRKYKNKPTMGANAKEVLENIDESNPVIKMFQEYRVELDAKHDRYEKLVKQSRDITIESKRIIFSLHSVHTDIESKREAVLEEAKTKLNKLVEVNFKQIAMDLNKLDSYQYHKAFTSGMQEFIEAFTFYQYIKENEIKTWKSINDLFQYKTEDELDLSLLFTQNDFIFGILDFTGELMRRCINTLGTGNIEQCFELCNFVKCIYKNCLGVPAAGQKEFLKKLYVLKQSLGKMELVCYNIKIRGEEIPKHMLVSVIESNEMNDEDDEGFF